MAHHLQRKDELHASSCILRWLNMYNFCLFRLSTICYCGKSPAGLDVRLFRVAFLSHRCWLARALLESYKTHWLHFHSLTDLQQFGWVRIEKSVLEKLHGEIWRHENSFVSPPIRRGSIGWDKQAAKNSLELFVLLSKQPSSVDRTDN